MSSEQESGETEEERGTPSSVGCPGRVRDRRGLGREVVRGLVEGGRRPEDVRKSLDGRTHSGLRWEPQESDLRVLKRLVTYEEK